MGRLLMAALEAAGFAPALASEFRSLDMAGDPTAQQVIRREAEAEASRLVDALRALPCPRRPRLWFTYHCHYKAPDWIGPAVADALSIPYVVAEGSRSARRAQGPWAIGHAGAEAALDRADRLLVMTQADKEDLEPALRAGQRLIEFPPFLDTQDWPRLEETRTADMQASSLRLLTVAMMREGDKLASYRLLAQALSHLPETVSWTLDVVGDGAARASVEELLRPFGARVRLHGLVSDRRDLAVLYAGAHLVVWPAFREAYCMTLLEAQMCGCPVVAGREGGVPAVVKDGETGILVPRRDPLSFARVLEELARDRTALARMARQAPHFVRTERSLAHAASILKSALAPLVEPADSPETATAPF